MENLTEKQILDQIAESEENIRKLKGQPKEEKSEELEKPPEKPRLQEQPIETEETTGIIKEKSLEELETELNLKRKDYAEFYALLKKEKTQQVFKKYNTAEWLEKNLAWREDREQRKQFIIQKLIQMGTNEQQAELIYETALKKAEYDKIKKEFGDKMLIEGKNSAEIFQKLILDERELLNQAQVESWPPKEKGIFRKGMEWWMRQGRAKRFLYSTAILAGVAYGASFMGLAGLTVAGIKIMPSAAGLFGASRFIRMGGGMLAGQLARTAGGGIDRWRTKVDEAEKEADFEELRQNFKDAYFFENIKQIEEEVREILENQAKRAGRRRLIIGITSMVVTIGGSIGMGWAEQSWAGDIVIKKIVVLPPIIPPEGEVPEVPEEEVPEEEVPPTEPEGKKQLEQSRESEASLPPKEEIALKKIKSEALPIKEVSEEKLEVWEQKVGKGDSPLSLAKKIYIEHAEKFGYRPEMGDVKKWAEMFSTRHIVGQYISEHPDEYKNLIEKIGKPSADPFKLDEWLHKVPVKTFNEILHNKVPNLVFEGDILKVDENENITAYNPEGKVRLGHIETVPEKIESIVKKIEATPEPATPEPVAPKPVTPEPAAPESTTKSEIVEGKGAGANILEAQVESLKKIFGPAIPSDIMGRNSTLIPNRGDGVTIIKNAFGNKGFDLLLTNKTIGVDGPSGWNWGSKSPWFGFGKRIPIETLNPDTIKSAKNFIIQSVKELNEKWQEEIK